MRTLPSLLLLIVSQFAFCLAVSAQSRPARDVIPTDLPQSDQRLILAVGTAMHRHAELYYYVCQDERGRTVVRALREATDKPGGKFPERIPLVPDIELTRFGARPQPKAAKYLNDLCLQHNQRRAAGITKADRPPPFMAGGFGPAPAGVATPPPQAAPRREPAPRTRGPAQSEYATIAREITESYRLAGDEVQGEPSARHMESLQRTAKEAAVQRAARHIVSLDRASDEAFERAKRIREERIQVARAVMARAERGGYTREKTYEYYDPSAKTFVQKTHTYDDSEAVYYTAKARLERLQRMSDDELRSQVEYDKGVQVHVARARAWDELLPDLPQQFAGPETAAPLVGVRLVQRKRSQAPVDPRLYQPRGFSERFDGQYVASNVSRRELRHVTLAVDFYHFSTVPEVTTRHVYYLPRWKAGETMMLSRMLVPDETRGGARYDVPIHYLDGNANTPANPELLEMAGVVRMDVTVWSNEARQRTTTLDIAQRIDKVAPALLEVMEGKLDNPAYTNAAKWMFNRYLPALISLLPADSPYSLRAKELLRDPDAARQKLATAHQGELLAACAEGKRYVGEWFGPGAAGRLGLLFIARDADGKRIRAEVFDPNKPERRRLVAGFIEPDRRTRTIMVMFEPVVPGEGVVTGEPNELRGNLLHPSIKSYRFQLRDGGFRGDASGSDLAGAAYDPHSRRHISLQPTEGDARELAEAKRRNASAPRNSPRAARPMPPTGSGGRALPRSTGARSTPRPSARPRTAAERRAEAARIAQQNQQALILLNLAKRALAAKNSNLARRYLESLMAAAPDSPAAKQAERLMRNLEP